jgi:hypothetical protein
MHPLDSDMHVPCRLTSAALRGAAHLYRHVERAIDGAARFRMRC